jgi:hypothetical protein
MTRPASPAAEMANDDQPMAVAPIRIPRDLLAAVETLAASEQRTVSAMLRILVREAFNARARSEDIVRPHAFVESGPGQEPTTDNGVIVCPACYQPKRNPIHI